MATENAPRGTTPITRAIARACPLCGAEPKKPCRWGAGRVPYVRVHLMRLEPDDRPPVGEERLMREDPEARRG